MDIYSNIFNRKACRKYDMTPLSQGTIMQIESFISKIPTLLPDVEIIHKIISYEEVKGLGVIKAPHYILISGKNQPLRDTCAGFIYQHAVLYIHSIGLAACWLAGVKSKQSNPDHIIGIGFGKPIEVSTRTIDEFKRKSINEIAKGTDSRLDAVRLAPSGMNGQPWYFAVEDKVIHVYYKKSIGGLLGMIYHHTDLDVGIALCHMRVAGEHEGKPFHFSINKKNTPTPPKDFIYIGTVE